MPIPNIDGMNPNGINQPNNERIKQSDPRESAAETADVESGTPYNPAYGQYLVNSNYNISSSKVNDDDVCMQEIYELDKSIYGELSSYESFEDFKSFISANHLSTYALRDGNGEIVGYYNLEPVNNGELYIDSMGLKPEYRKTRKGDVAIQTAWNKILETARGNEVESLSLHVDSSDTDQVELYEQLGFYREQDLPNYWGNGKNAYFMKYAVNDVSPTVQQTSPDGDIIFSKANDNDSEMRAIYDIDSDAFAEQDPFDSYEDYIRYLDEHNTSVYSVKNKDNELLGYYAFEPVTDGNMYIYSIALKPEYRNSRIGYKAIQESWPKILVEAKAQGAIKLSLHVDAENPRLEKMYKHFGFTTISKEPKYYQNGNDALYMECPIGNGLEESAVSELEPAVHSEETTLNGDTNPVESEKETVANASKSLRTYNEDVKKAEQILESKQIPERTGIKAKTIISHSSYIDEDGNDVFDDELFTAAMGVAELFDGGEGSKIRDGSTFIGILRRLKEHDEEGNINVRGDVVPYLAQLKDSGISMNEIDRILYSVRVKDGEVSRISTKELNEVLYLSGMLPNDKKRNISGIIEKCMLKDKEGNTHISHEMLTCYKRFINSHEDDYDVEHVFKACTSIGDDGSEYFNEDSFNMLNKYFNGKNEYGNPCKIYSLRILPQVYKQGITIDFYMNKCSEVMNDDVFKNTLKQYNKQSDVNASGDSYTDPDIINTAAILKAISYRTYEEKPNYWTGAKEKVPTDHIDNAAKDVLKEYCEKGIPFNNIMSFAHTMSACKEKKSPYSFHEEFNPEILKKAIQLKEIGISEEDIPGIIEACMFEELHFSGRKIKTFNDDMFRHVFLKCSQDSKNIYPEKVRLSKDYIDGKWVFNPEVFDMLAERFVPFDESKYGAKVTDFQVKYPDGNRIFNKDLFLAWYDAGSPNITMISDTTNQGYKPNAEAIAAYKTLKAIQKEENWSYTPQTGGVEKDPVNLLMFACKDEFGNNYQWNNRVYEHVIDLIGKGYSINEILNLVYNCKESIRKANSDISNNIFFEEKYDYAMSLVEQGIDIVNAGRIADACINKGKMANPNIDKMLELYSLGSENPVGDVKYCINDKSNDVDEVAYERLKDALSRGLKTDVIPQCRDKGEFSDRLYRYALSLQERGYSSEDIVKFMDECHVMETDNSTGKIENVFKQNIYDHIGDIEQIGIAKDKVLKVLASCKYNSFSEEAFSKIHELHSKQYDDDGIAVFIGKCKDNNKFSPENFDLLLKLSKRHLDLRDSAHGDDYILSKLLDKRQKIDDINTYFGEDVLNYATSMKIDGYINFVNQCSDIFANCDSEFRDELKSKLEELPSPELKVKRLRVIGGMAPQVSTDALRPLLNLIRSPEMTEEQIELAHRIFTPEVNKEDYPDDMSQTEIEIREYEKRVDKFIEEINTPYQNRQAVRDFLMKERLDKSIDRPKSIDEQKAQMENSAQQVLINPKIPLEKKIKYIDEYKAKIKDMDANPDKYLKPQIYPKPIEKLKTVVEAYVNIPNDEIRFNNTIKETMYLGMQIDTTPELLTSINYDSRYFDKLFSAQDGFKRNFRKLIELKKMNMDIPLTEARTILPEENTEKYEQYQRLGLIEQIKANLDTKRQFEEHNLDFDKWNSFDDNLRGEIFTSEADPETEYKNLKYNVINVFQDELWNSISTEETKKLTDYLASKGFKIYNNNIYKSGQVATNLDIENFVNLTVQYIGNKDYWKNVNVNSDLPSDEIAGVAGFTDHINGLQRRIEEIKGAKTINNIHFRLIDDNDIGRNIFFGNHVGCCNSVESTYAGYSAPMHLLNNYNRGVELVDEWGNSYGNSLCFFADIDNKLTFVIDSFEANGKLGSNPLVAENLIKFAKQVCKEMGRPDARIMVGPNYNHMDKSLLDLTGAHSIKVLGTVSDMTYCDSIGGKVKNQINEVVEGRNMYVIKE